MPTNFGDGCVLERTWRFQTASCAFMSPALRPTRGSGLCGVADMLAAGEAPLPFIEDVDCAQAAVSSSPTTRGSDGRWKTASRAAGRRARNTDAIANSSRGGGGGADIW